MGAGNATALVLAVAANALCVAVAVGMWRRHRRRRRAERSQHPSARPPLGVDFVDTARGRRLGIHVPSGAPPLEIDIVSFRPARETVSWDSEPIDESIAIDPGGSVVLRSSLPLDEHEFDVVVAWTARHPTGLVRESHLFRLPSDREEPTPPSRVAALPAGPALVLAALAAVAGALSLTSLTSDDHTDGRVADAVASSTPNPTTTTTPAVTTTIDARPGATTVPTTVDDVPTTEAATPEAPTNTTAATTTTADPTTSTPLTGTSSGTTPGDDARVIASARIGECRFGDQCLIAGFTIEGFDPRPSEYVCEFEDGSRFSFRFDSDGVETACSTGTETAAITIEVGGIRSNTVTRDDV